MTDRTVPSASPPVSPAYRGVVLAMLLLVYTFNFLDRQILGILAGPIKAELGLTDGQLGALGGIAMCHARLGNEEQARKCAEAALPPERSGREAWVEGMLVEMDARLADIPEE